MKSKSAPPHAGQTNYTLTSGGCVYGFVCWCLAANRTVFILVVPWFSCPSILSFFSLRLSVSSLQPTPSCYSVSLPQFGLFSVTSECFSCSFQIYGVVNKLLLHFSYFLFMKMRLSTKCFLFFLNCNRLKSLR